MCVRRPLCVHDSVFVQCSSVCGGVRVSNRDIHAAMSYLLFTGKFAAAVSP